MKQAACCLVLAVSRRNNPNMWGLPGGKAEPSESLEAAAKRELQEETGLVAHDLFKIFSRFDADGFETTTFACEVEGTIQTLETGLVNWIKPSVLVNPASSPFAEYNAALFVSLYQVCEAVKEGFVISGLERWRGNSK
jgi:8-oxo-dGTP pyrophosphatase MutT (NUDIX family)